MAIFGAVDFPGDRSMVAREGFVVYGFAFDDATGPFVRVDLRHRGVDIGASALRHRRPDVTTVFPHIREVACGFRVTATLPPGPAGDYAIDVCVTFADGTTWDVQRVVSAGEIIYSQRPYGTLLYPDITHVYDRKQIYSVGPPSPSASDECVELLKSYLTPGEPVIDVGCGVGAYGPPLIEAGIPWQGCEVNESFVEQLRERDLPVSLVSGDTLPFEDDAFETAICIEVLEHIVDYDAFLAEIARITRRRVLVSVPNAEAIPVLADRLTVPWHMLEADHKNFFTRPGLRTALARHFQHAEILPYGVMPLVSSNGAQVYYHLFAVAEHKE